jgi:hypothetical protein
MKKLLFVFLIVGVLLTASCKEEPVTKENEDVQISVQTPENADMPEKDETETEPEIKSETEAEVESEIQGGEEIQAILDGALMVTEYDSKQQVFLFDLGVVNDLYAGKPSRYAIGDIDEDGVYELVVEFSLAADKAVIKKTEDDWTAKHNLDSEDNVLLDWINF